jgi:trans-aconitate 2-methyltransferase
MRREEEQYRWDVHDYHTSSSVQTQWGKELIAKLRLSGNEHILDIGSGDGKLTADLASFAPTGTVVGIDSSPEMVAFAKAMFPPASFHNLSFRVMDATAIAFEGLFDVVFSNATLHWVIDHRAVLMGIKRSLKKGGRVLLQMGGRGNAEDIVTAMATAIDSAKWERYYNDFIFPYSFYGPEAYGPWLEGAGLKTVRAELVTKDMVHQDRKGLEAWIRTTWLPYLQKLPNELRSSFITEVVGRYLTDHPVDDRGCTHVRMIRLEVEAIHE